MRHRPRRATGASISVAPGDLVADAVAGMRSRPGRTWASIAMTAVGVATAIAVLGVAEMGRLQINSTFDRFRATTLRVESDVGGRLDADSVAGINRVPNVEGAVLIRASASLPATARPGLTNPIPIQVLEAAHGNLEVLSPGLPNRLPPGTAIVGSRLRDALGISPEAIGTSIWINGIPHTIAAFTPDSTRLDAALNAVVIGSGGLSRLGTAPESDILAIQVRAGSATAVGEVAATAALPGAPSTLSVAAPPEPAKLRSTISGDVRLVTLAASALLIILGILAIASSVALAVIERTGEIGLRRVLGAHRRHIASLILVESGLTGLLGGSLGAAAGTVVVNLYAAWNRWSPAYQPALVLASAGVGLAAGLIAGLAPAIRATKIEPSAALRQDT